MPLAKSTTIEEAPVQKSSYTKTDAEAFKFYDLQHPELYRYFNINPVDNTGNKEFQYISKWAFDGSKSVSDALQKIKAVERKLGQADTGMPRLTKIFNYIRMSDSYKATSKELRGRIESVQAQYRIKLSEIKEAKRERMSKLNEEISRIEKEYKVKTESLKRYYSKEAEDIKNEFSSQLKDLKGMKEVYGK